MNILLIALLAVKLGAPLTLTESTTIDKLLAKPDDFVGKTVQVKGKITQVCQAMGCWMEVADPDSGKSLKIDAEHGGMAFPKDAAGKSVVAEGKLVKSVMTKEEVIAQAKHEAQEQNHKFNPKKIKSGATIYSIKGTGAVLE